MPKRKGTPKNPRAEDLPVNPEFQEFADFAKKLMQVPKEEVDKRVAEDRKRRSEGESG